MSAPAARHPSNLDVMGERPSPAESVRILAAATTSSDNRLLEILRDLGATVKRLEERIIVDSGTLGTTTLARGNTLELVPSHDSDRDDSEKVGSSDHIWVMN
jgi:hypothetical protein